MQEHKSEVARLRERIEQENFALQLGLTGFAQGAAKHSFINARMERIGICGEELASVVGEEEANRTVCEIIDQDVVEGAQNNHRAPDDVVDMQGWQQAQALHASLLSESGSLLPMQLHFAQARSLLDVGCGYGAWLLAMARVYPHIQFIGVDRHEEKIAVANAMARREGLSNVICLCQDLQRIDELHFPHGAFDVIRLAFLAETILSTDYAALADSLFRLCCAGGTMLWTEMELPTTNSPAFEELTRLLCLGLQKAGHTFTPVMDAELATVYRLLWGERPRPEPRGLGITPMLGYWLRKAGCHNVMHHVEAIEISADRPMHETFVGQVESFIAQITPWLLRMDVTTLSAYEEVLASLWGEIRAPSFCGLCLLLTACGQKP